MTHIFETEIEEFGDVEVEYETYPSYRGARDSYGVPLEPDEDASLEILSIKFNGEEIMELVSNEDLKYIEQQIIDSWDDYEPDYPDYDDEY